MSIPAKVAYPEQMLEDKSAGIYIKTENWRDDDDFEGRGGNRRGGRGDKRGNGGHKDSHGHGKDGGKRHEKPDFYGKGKKDYKKDGYKKDFNKVKKFDDKEIAGMENMSFEDRMKLYKEKYGNSKSSGYRNNRDGKKNYSKGGYTNAGGKGKKSYAGKNSRQNAQKQPEKKMGLIAKIKAFFGRK